jgi:hypothetical protein
MLEDEEVSVLAVIQQYVIHALKVFFYVITITNCRKLQKKEILSVWKVL